MKMKISCTKIEAENILAEYFESIITKLNEKNLTNNKPIDLEVKIE